jgi:hypothetical protein
MYGHPELTDATPTGVRSGWVKRAKHTAHISTLQLAAMIDYALQQHTFVMFRLAVITAVMATSGLRRINVLVLCPYDFLFYSDRLVIFAETCKLATDHSARFVIVQLVRRCSA